MLNTIQIDDSAVAICINQQFPHCFNAEDLYTCTRGLWRLNKKRAEKAKYIFAVYQGIIKEVFEVDEWIEATKAFRNFWVERLRTQGRNISPAEHDGRYEFNGRVANESVRNKYVGKRLPIRHGQNPIRYFNC
jgi:uncharacterized protein